MIGHAHQDARPLPTEVETGDKVNDQGGLLRQLVKGCRNEDLAAIGLDGQLQARHAPYLGRPRPGHVDYHRGRDLALVGHHCPHLPPANLYVESFRLFANPHPQPSGLPGKAHSDTVGIGVAIARAESAPHHVVQIEIGSHITDLARRQQAYRHTHALLYRHVGLKFSPVLRLCGQEQVAMLPEIYLRLELLCKAFEGLDAFHGDADIGFRGELQSDAASTQARGAGGQLLLLHQHDVLAAQFGQVIGGAGPHDPTADDHYVCFFDHSSSSKKSTHVR